MGRPDARHDDVRLLRRRLLVQREMKGNDVVRLAPDPHGHANHGHACVKGRFAFGYATHRDRVTHADDPRANHRPVARGHAGKRPSTTRPANSAASRRKYGTRFDRRHHVVALHQ